MSEERIVRKSPAELADTQADWTGVEQLTDDEIQAAIDSDPDAAPEVDEAWFREAVLGSPVNKIATSLRVDADVLEWYRGQGRGWQTRINALLRAYAEAHGLKKTG